MISNPIFRTAAGKMRAERYGHWLKAGFGNVKSQRWCIENGIGLVKAESEGVDSAGGFIVPLDFDPDVISIIETQGAFRRGKKVDVVNYPDGRFTVQFEGTPLPFRVFDKIQTVTPGAIVENKRLGAALAMVKEHQATYTPNKRRYDPARGRPPNNLEAPRMPTKGRPRRSVAATPPA